MSKPTPMELYFEAHPNYVSKMSFSRFVTLLEQHGYAITKKPKPKVDLSGEELLVDADGDLWQNTGHALTPWKCLTDYGGAPSFECLEQEFGPLKRYKKGKK